MNDHSWIHVVVRLKSCIFQGDLGRVCKQCAPNPKTCSIRSLVSLVSEWRWLTGRQFWVTCFFLCRHHEQYSVKSFLKSQNYPINFSFFYFCQSQKLDYELICGHFKKIKSKYFFHVSPHSDQQQLMIRINYRYLCKTIIVKL